MAVFRKINIDFWEDAKIVDDFTPEDKFFYLYLMTNPHTNQIGCYGLTYRQMEFETGYNKDTITKLIKRFSENLDVITYDDNAKEILIKNWHKYNWTLSPKVITCILNEYKNIKSETLRAYIDSLLIQYEYSIDTVCIQKHNKNKNKNKEKEEEQEQEQQNCICKENYFKNSNPDFYFSDDKNKIFKIYEKECPKLIKITGEKRNRKILDKVSDFLSETDYDWDYFTNLCKKANSLKSIANTKIDFEMMLNCHIGIMNGKYEKDGNKKGISQEFIDDFFENLTKEEAQNE